MCTDEPWYHKKVSDQIMISPELIKTVSVPIKQVFSYFWMTPIDVPLNTTDYYFKSPPKQEAKKLAFYY